MEHRNCRVIAIPHLRPPVYKDGHIIASFPGFPFSFPSLSHTASDGKLEGKPGNEARHIIQQTTATSVCCTYPKCHENTS